MNEKTNTASNPPSGDGGIFLVGMMGSGKSHWSKKLSKKLKCGGYDLDYLVETNEEKTITEIFEEDGEEYFRKAEAKVLRWFAQKKTFVLATGGGTPCFNDNMAWMNKHGVTIWLDEPIATLVSRLGPEKSHRPLLKNMNNSQLEQFLTDKRAEREIFYAKAQYHITGNVTDSSFAEILKHHA